MNSKTVRIYWIDNLKAVGILLVMAGHLITINPYLKDYIYSFHMPLFFFISGFVFKPQNYPHPKEFIIKKLSTLILPYFFFASLAYLQLLFVDNYLQQMPLTFSNVEDAFLRIIHANGFYLEFAFNPALWFLPCLFLVELEFYALSFLKKWLQLLMVLVLFVLGILVGRKFEHLPWTFAASFVALFFYGSGFFLKGKTFLLNNNKRLTILIGGFFSLLFCILNGGGVVLGLDSYGKNPFYFLLSSLGGITLAVSLIAHTKPYKKLNDIGRNTLIILGLHLPLDLTFRKLIEHYHLQSYYFLIPKTSINLLNPIITFLNQTLATFIFISIELIIILLLIPTINRYFYFFLGREKPSQ